MVIICVHVHLHLITLKVWHRLFNVCTNNISLQENSSSSSQKDILAMACDSVFENIEPQSPESIAPVDSAYSSPTSQDFGASTSPDIENRARMQEMNDSSVSFSTSPTHVDKLQFALNWNVTFDPKSHGVTSPSPEVGPDTTSEITGDALVSSPQQSPAPPTPLSPQVSSQNQEESTSPSRHPTPQTPAHSPSPAANFSPISSEPIHPEKVNFQVSLPSSSSPPAVSWLSIGSSDNLSTVNFASDQTSFEELTVKSETFSGPKNRSESPVSVPELKFSAMMTLGNFFDNIPDISEEQEGCDEPPSKRRCVSTSPYMSEADWMDLLGKYNSSPSFPCMCSRPSPAPTQDYALPPQMAFPSKFRSIPWATNHNMYYRQRSSYFADVHITMTTDNYIGYFFTLPMEREQKRWATPHHAAPEFNWVESTAYVQSKTKAEQRKGKPQDSYISMIGHAILASPTFQASLPEIYDYIMEHYPFYRTTTLAWRNAVRHNLSANECFVKAERTETGRGWMWTIHPSCVDQFRKGDFRRREARNRVQHLQRRTN